MIENESNGTIVHANEVRNFCKIKHMKDWTGRTFDVSFPAIAIRTWPVPTLSSSALHCRQPPQGQYHESEFTTGKKM